MESILKAFQEAEELLKLAEQKVQTINPTGIKEEVAMIADSFRQKADRVRESIQNKKAQLLKEILAMALIFPEKCFCLHRRNTRQAHYYFDTEGNKLGVKIHGAELRYITPEEFVQTEEVGFYGVCNGAIRSLQDYLRNAAQKQQEDVSKLAELENSLRKTLEALAVP